MHVLRVLAFIMKEKIMVSSIGDLDRAKHSLKEDNLKERGPGLLKITGSGILVSLYLSSLPRVLIKHTSFFNNDYEMHISKQAEPDSLAKDR